MPKPSLVYFLYIYFVAGILSSEGKERGGLSNALIKLDNVANTWLRSSNLLIKSWRV
jgi:hypothetical protein